MVNDYIQIHRQPTDLIPVLVLHHSPLVISPIWFNGGFKRTIMIDQEILNFLGERGLAAESVLYAHIREWEAWWRGKNRAFHEYLENNAMGRPVRREMFRMNMAKKICED